MCKGVGVGGPQQNLYTTTGGKLQFTGLTKSSSKVGNFLRDQPVVRRRGLTPPPSRAESDPNVRFWLKADSFGRPFPQYGSSMNLFANILQTNS